MMVDNKEIVITGKLIKIAKIKEEWYEDIENPSLFVERFKKNNVKADIFSFWQRLPENKPKYNYYMEWDSIAVLPITSFKNWFEKQINSKSRKHIRQAQKKDVIIMGTIFDDEFIKGMVNVFNETPIRQGKPFWHYGLGFNEVKQVFSQNIHREDIVGAYYNGELIGFIMLAHADKYSMFTQIISKIEHLDKSPNYALMAKAIEICESKKTPYLIFGYWPRTSLADFKRYNAFEKIDLPRYYVPLTMKGKIALKLYLLHGIAGVLPEKIILRLIDLRSKWYSKKTKSV